jgi:hypothetical protein
MGIFFVKVQTHVRPRKATQLIFLLELSFIAPQFEFSIAEHILCNLSIGRQCFLLCSFTRAGVPAIDICRI